ncbi:MAG TPA: hypothetical protein VF026_02305 [Ktedonobacteraceae bacterium]
MLTNQLESAEARLQDAERGIAANSACRAAPRPSPAPGPSTSCSLPLLTPVAHKNHRLTTTLVGGHSPCSPATLRTGTIVCHQIF